MFRADLILQLVNLSDNNKLEELSECFYSIQTQFPSLQSNNIVQSHISKTLFQKITFP